MGRQDDSPGRQDFEFLDDFARRVPFFVRVLIGVVGGFIGYFVAMHYGWIPKRGGFFGFMIGFLLIEGSIRILRITVVVVGVAAFLWLYWWIFFKP